MGDLTSSGCRPDSNPDPLLLCIMAEYMMGVHVGVRSVPTCINPEIIVRTSHAGIAKFVWPQDLRFLSYNYYLCDILHY